MATVSITLNGVIYPKGRSAADQPIPATFVGDAWLTDLGVGGGPILPPVLPPQPGVPIHPIWGPPGINLPPGPGFPPVAGHPLPPITPPLPPEVTPPNPGDPTTPMPPPAGSAGWPVQPITPPPYIVINYPGVGPVIVAPPASNS
jgi:hypothetical protein